MKRVLYICEYRSTYSGNFIKSICVLIEKMKMNGYECYIAFPELAKKRDWVSYFIDGRIIFLDFNTSHYSFAKTIMKTINELKIDIVHSHFVSVNRMKLLSFFCPKTRMYIHLHSDFSSGRKSFKMKIKDYLTYNILVSKIRFICVSNEFVKNNPKNSIWIPNGLVCDCKDRKLQDRDSLRMKLGVKDTDVLIELYGWSPLVKGVDIAVRTVKSLDECGFNFKLAIVCGVQYDEYRMKKFIADNTECSGNESFLVYLPPIEDVFSYHHASDILLSASRSEGFSYAALEMLSLGKRCVISDIPGTSWANEYSCVTSFRSGDSVSCKEALLMATKLPPYNSTIEDTVKRTYSIEKWANAVMEAYAKM